MTSSFTNSENHKHIHELFIYNKSDLAQNPVVFPSIVAQKQKSKISFSGCRKA